MPKNNVSAEQSKHFNPIEIPSVTAGLSDPRKITVTTSIRGKAADEFEAMCENYGLNRSQLLTQMVYHCLGRSEELKDFYRRVAILGR